MERKITINKQPTDYGRRKSVYPKSPLKRKVKGPFDLDKELREKLVELDIKSVSVFPDEY